MLTVFAPSFFLFKALASSSLNLTQLKRENSAKEKNVNDMVLPCGQHYEEQQRG